MKLNVHTLREGEGVPIVLLHGWLGSGIDFEALVAAGDFEGRTVLAVDLPGHGESSDYDREYDFVEVAEAVAGVLAEQAVDLVGYSMGGRLALYIAGTRPHLVQRLALINAHPGIEHPVQLRERLELDAERATELMADPADFLDQWVKQPLFGPANTAPWKQVLARRQGTADSHAFAWARALVCMSLGRQLSLWNIPYLTMTPTLYLVGTKDEKYVDIAREFRAQNPATAGVALIVGAHHAPHLDRPEEVARRLTSFFNVVRD